MEAFCRLEGITKSYQRQTENCEVFDRMELDIDLGKITVVVGRSGSGKTTLLRMLAGLEKADAGNIRFLRDEVEFIPRMGMVFQEPRLLPWHNVIENVLIHQKKPDWQQGTELLKKVGLAGAEYLQVKELSGGMASRVAIARAFAYEPDILLMDEPFAALDYFTKRSMEQLVIALYQQEKKGIIFVTHDLEEALLLGQDILILDRNHEPMKISLREDYPRDIAQQALQQIKIKIMDKLKISEGL